MVELETLGTMRREQEQAVLLPAQVAPPFRQPFDEVLRQRLARAGLLRELGAGVLQRQPAVPVVTPVEPVRHLAGRDRPGLARLQPVEQDPRSHTTPGAKGT